MHRLLMTLMRTASLEGWVIGPALDKFKREWEVRSLLVYTSLKRSYAARGSKEIGQHLLGEERIKKRCTSDGRNSNVLKGSMQQGGMESTAQGKQTELLEH